MSPNITEEEQDIRESQYNYLYQYSPYDEEGRFPQLQCWSWGIHHLGGIRVVFEQLDGWPFDLLVDVDCGEDRFLCELAADCLSNETPGIDSCERSIEIARGINIDSDYEVIGSFFDHIGRKYDVKSVIEVVKGILFEDIDRFVERVTGLLIDDGQFVLTVPQTNNLVQDKHYQHFLSADLESVLNPLFDSISFVPFDKKSKIFTALELVRGGRDQHFVVNSPPIIDSLYRLYERRYLYADRETNCRRIAAICHL